MKEILTTKRLRLKKTSYKDLKDLYNLTSKEEVNRFNPSGPDKSIKDTEKILTFWMNEDWNKKGIGYYFVRDIKTDEFIGYIGLSLRDFLNIEFLNLAYRIEPKFQGKGIVIEACEKIISEAKEEHKNKIIHVLTMKQNIPSIRTAEKLGFIHNPKFNDIPNLNEVHLFNVPIQISNAWFI